MEHEYSFPIRRPNRLARYDYSQPGYYFVTLCTKDKQHLLGKVVGGDVLIAPQVVLSQTGQVVEQVISSMSCVEKYVVMPNHIHLLLHLSDTQSGPMRTSAPTYTVRQVPPLSIPGFVRYLKRRVTLTLGTTIWQRSYHDHIIRNEADYLRIWTYIDTNPAKWQDDCYFIENEGN